MALVFQKEKKLWFPQLNSLAVNSKSGVEAGCDVVQDSPASLNVDINAGTYFLEGAEKTMAAQTVTCIPDAGNERWAIVLVDSTGTTSISHGTAAAVPHPPVYDTTTHYCLAMILIPQGATSIVTADIYDNRCIISGVGGGGGLDKYKEDFTSQTSVTVTHNLQDANPSVTVYNNSDEIITPDSVTITDADELVVTFNTAETGTIVVQGGNNAGGEGGIGRYTEDFTSQTQVVVTHNLSDLYPQVQVYDNNGEQITPSKIDITDEDTVTIDFAVATTGKIVIHAGVFAGGTGAGNFLPVSDDTYDIGSSSFKWRNAYFSGKLTVDGSIDPTDLALDPQASPPTVAKGKLYFDSVANKLKVSEDGSTYVEVGAGAGTLNEAYTGGNTITVSGSPVTFTQTATTGNAFYVTRNLAAGSTDDSMVYIYNQNASDDKAPLEVRNDGVGDCVYINQTNASATGRALQVVIPDARTTWGIEFSDATGNSRIEFMRQRTSNNGSNRFYRNLAAADTAGPIVLIENANASDDRDTLKIDHANPSGAAIYVVTTDYGIAIDRSGNTTTASTASFKDNGGGASTNYAQFARGGDTDRRTGYFYRNLGSANTGGSVVTIHNDNSGDDQGALEIRNDCPRFCIFAQAYDVSSIAVFRRYSGTGSNSASLVKIQNHSTGGDDCLWLDQDDSSYGFIRFDGTVGSGSSFNVRSDELTTFYRMVKVKSGTSNNTGWIKIYQ